jgi:ribosomal protein S18 acetylase RimI-like enzyme
VNHGDRSARGRGEAATATGRLPARLRLRAWPYEPEIGVVLPTDHQSVPTADAVQGAIDAARARGFAVLRTGALFPRAAAAFAEAGFRPIDRLALLDVSLDGVALPTTAMRTRPLRRWQLASAAAVDLAAFGAPWGNDATALGEIRAATPAHRARRIDVDGTTVAFCMSGGAGRTGYLQRLAVAPDHQRKGSATVLVVDALGWMRRRGLAEAVVNTGVGNAAALALYERFGFRRRPEVLVIAERSLGDQSGTPASSDRADQWADGRPGDLADDVADADR